MKKSMRVSLFMTSFILLVITAFAEPFSSDAKIYYGDTIALKTAHGKYVYVNQGQGVDVPDTGPQIGGWEPLIITKADNPNFKGPVRYNEKIWLRSVHGTQIGARDNGTAYSHSNLGTWETLTIVPTDNNRNASSPVPYLSKAAFLSVHNKFITALDTGKLGADRTAIGSWESFEIQTVKLNRELSGFKQIPGGLVQVEIGRGGKTPEVWGVNSGGAIFRLNSNLTSWTSMGGSNWQQVSVGEDGTVWALTKSGEPYRFDGKDKWTKLSGWLSYISVGGKDKICGIGGENRIYYYDNGAATWKELPGGGRALNVSVGKDGSIFLTGTDYRLYRYTGASTWQQLLPQTTPGNKVTFYEHGYFGGWGKGVTVGDDFNLPDVGIPNDNVSSIKVEKGYAVTIYEHWKTGNRGNVRTLYESDDNLHNNGWGDTISSARVFNVDAEQAWVNEVSNGDDEYVLTTMDGNQQYLWNGRYQTYLRGVRLTRADIAADGSIVGLGPETVEGGHSIYMKLNENTQIYGLGHDNNMYRLMNGTWELKAGTIQNITMSYAGVIYGIGMDNSVWRWERGEWIKIAPPAVKDIVVDKTNVLWGIGMDNYLYKYNGSSWEQKKGGITNIVVSAKNKIYAIGTDKKVYAWDGTNFQNVAAGDVKHIAVDSDEGIWGVGYDNILYYWSGNNWNAKKGSVYNIWATQSGEIYSVGTDNAGYLWSPGENIWRNIAPGTIKDIVVSNIDSATEEFEKDGIYTIPPRNGKYMWLDDKVLSENGRSIITFEAKTENDITIGLSKEKYSDTGATSNKDMYELLIGGWGNTKSVIRKRTQTAEIVSSASPKTDAANWKAYWIMLYDGALYVGEGSEPNIKDAKLKLNDNDKINKDIKYIGLSSWDKTVMYKNIQIKDLDEAFVKNNADGTFTAKPTGGYLKYNNSMKLPEDGRGIVTFEAKGTDNLFIHFSNNTDRDFENGKAIYEMIIGGNNNAGTWLRRANHGADLAVNGRLTLEQNKWQKYFAFVYDGWIGVGKGEPTYENIAFETYDKNPMLDVRYFALGTASANPIDFRNVSSIAGMLKPITPPLMSAGPGPVSGSIIAIKSIATGKYLQVEKMDGDNIALNANSERPKITYASSGGSGSTTKTTGNQEEQYDYNKDLQQKKVKFSDVLDKLNTLKGLQKTSDADFAPKKERMILDIRSEGIMGLSVDSMDKLLPFVDEGVITKDELLTILDNLVKGEVSAGDYAGLYECFVVIKGKYSELDIESKKSLAIENLKSCTINGEKDSFYGKLFQLTEGRQYITIGKKADQGVSSVGVSLTIPELAKIKQIIYAPKVETKITQDNSASSPLKKDALKVDGLKALFEVVRYGDNNWFALRSLATGQLVQVRPADITSDNTVRNSFVSKQAAGLGEWEAFRVNNKNIFAYKGSYLNVLENGYVRGNETVNNPVKPGGIADKDSQFEIEVLSSLRDPAPLHAKLPNPIFYYKDGAKENLADSASATQSTDTMVTIAKVEGSMVAFKVGKNGTLGDTRLGKIYYQIYSKASDESSEWSISEPKVLEFDTIDGTINAKGDQISTSNLLDKTAYAPVRVCVDKKNIFLFRATIDGKVAVNKFTFVGSEIRPSLDLREIATGRYDTVYEYQGSIVTMVDIKLLSLEGNPGLVEKKIPVTYLDSRDKDGNWLFERTVLLQETSIDLKNPEFEVTTVPTDDEEETRYVVMIKNASKVDIFSYRKAEDGLPLNKDYFAEKYRLNDKGEVQKADGFPLRDGYISKGLLTKSITPSQINGLSADWEFAGAPRATLYNGRKKDSNGRLVIEKGKEQIKLMMMTAIPIVNKNDATKTKTVAVMHFDFANDGIFSIPTGKFELNNARLEDAIAKNNDWQAAKDVVTEKTDTRDLLQKEYDTNKSRYDSLLTQKDKGVSTIGDVAIGAEITLYKDKTEQSKAKLDTAEVELAVAKANETAKAADFEKVKNNLSASGGKADYDKYKSGERTFNPSGNDLVLNLKDTNNFVGLAAVLGNVSVLNSADGKVHMYMAGTDYRVYQTVYVANQFKWSADGAGVKVGNYKKLSNIFYREENGYPERYSVTAPEVCEYGVSKVDNKKVVGYVNRFYVYYHPQWNSKEGIMMTEWKERVGDLKAVWLSEVMTDETLVGYIEGAPPVPGQNLRGRDADYNDASTIAYNVSKSDSFSFTKEGKAGAGIKTEGRIGPFGFAWDAEVKGGAIWGSEFATGMSSAIDLTLGLRGNKTLEGSEFMPRNIGVAVVEGVRADIYALMVEGSDDVYGYQVIPIEFGGKTKRENRIIPFKLNDRYVKQGNIETYKDYYWKDVRSGSLDKDEKKLSSRKIETDISIKRAALKNYYEDTAAVLGMGIKNEFLNKNLISTYVWDALSGGVYKETEQTSFTHSDSIGSSLEFNIMAGVGGDFAANVPFLGRLEFGDTKFLVGAYGEFEAKKTKTNEEGFGFDVSINIDKEGMFDPSGNYLPGAIGKKVDYYVFKTYLLEPDQNNMNDFFEYVVDKTWMKNSTHDGAKRLTAISNKPFNNVWRILYRVTEASYCGDLMPASKSFRSAGKKGESAGDERTRRSGSNVKVRGMLSPDIIEKLRATDDQPVRKTRAGAGKGEEETGLTDDVKKAIQEMNKERQDRLKGMKKLDNTKVKTENSEVTKESDAIIEQESKSEEEKTNKVRSMIKKDNADKEEKANKTRGESSKEDTSKKDEEQKSKVRGKKE